jgi:hypothetical protein
MDSSNDYDTLAAGVERGFPALRRFFGGYFHQDWQQDYSSTRDAVTAYLHDVPPASAATTVEELDRMLAMQLDDATLGMLLRESFGCNYVPQVDELSNRAWLERVRDALRPAKPA